MRVMAPAAVRAGEARHDPAAASARTRRHHAAARVEAIALAGVTVVAMFGVTLTYLGRTRVATAADSGLAAVESTLDLRHVRGSDDVVPILGMFSEPYERREAARAIYRYLAAGEPDHVGDLSHVTIPAADVRREPRFVRLRARLDERPALAAVPVLGAADLASLKPRVVVRTLAEFRTLVVRGTLLFVAAFWAAHVIRRLRRTLGDPVLLPVVMLLCAIGLVSLVALRDPLRDTVPFARSMTGILAGVALLVVASEFDVEASPARRAVVAPLGVAVGLAALLWAFGTGPGTTGTRLRLFGFQPADVIRLAVVFALAAHFARRGEFLREYALRPARARGWLRRVTLPRWRDVGPAIVSVAVVIAFFFLQRDLGPALVLACVFLGMYGVARQRGLAVVGGLCLVLLAFGAAHWTGVPVTVRQRVAIWLDPWRNGLPGGDQVAHGLWAMSTGALWGSGLGRGSGGVVPAGDTDFILAIAGEELGFAGVAVLVLLCGLLCWRCLRIAVRAPGEFSALLTIGIALSFAVQACVIASGVLDLLPLSGVVTPFLSFGRSAMVANLLAVGIVLGISRRQHVPRPQMRAPVRAVAVVLSVAGAAVLARAGWIQIVRADDFAVAPVLTQQADGTLRFVYNPRLVSAARLIERGSIYDRHGLPVATSNAREIAEVPARYRSAGLSSVPCVSGDRCYPMGGALFHVLGDWRTQMNWGAPNSSYVERDRDARLDGYDDHARVVEVTNPRTGVRARTALRDLRELLPLARDRFERRPAPVRALLARDRNVRLSIDARLQARVASALASGMAAGGHARGAAVVLDPEHGDVLASVSYPQPAREGAPASPASAPNDPAGSPDPALLDRARYGLYPPGSTFKILVAAAALRGGPVPAARTFSCVSLPDGRVGAYLPGLARPVRDDVMDHVAHGTVDLRRGLVVSCNAYFAQLATALGPQPLLEAASLFDIDVARPQTAARLRRTLAHAGYGQGEVLVSPVKMARAIGAVADRGGVVPLRWVLDPAATNATAASGRLLERAQAELLGRHLREVVTSGTGRTLRGNATPIAGKTGTAEIEGAPAHSWFAGFAPYGSAGQPQIAFAVVVEHAGYGAHAAAPIAGAIVDAARDLGLIR